MDSDLISRAAEERQKIFERYELGRTAPVDPWEDPEKNIYTMIDRWVVQTMGKRFRAFPNFFRSALLYAYISNL